METKIDRIINIVSNPLIMFMMGYIFATIVAIRR